MPLRTSASVTAVVNSVLIEWPSIQAVTSGCGWARINSETTLVSRMIIAQAVQSNRGGSRIGSLGGISNSTSPKGLNNSWIAVPRF